MTDITSIVAASRVIDIRHPATSEPIGLQITLLPDSDPRVREVVRKQLNDRLLGRTKLDAAQIDANRTDLIVAAASGWDWQGDTTFDGNKPEFNGVELRRVLKRLPWIIEQIDKELGDTAAFFRGNDQAAD